MRPRVSIVGMIYKSVEYLNFMTSNIREFCLSSSQYDVDYLIVANDPLDHVRAALSRMDVPHLVYHDPKPADYYLNRVYRAWNFGGRSAKGDIIVFVNSDMAFTPGWLEALLSVPLDQYLPCSRLIESGKLLSGEHAVSADFGKTPSLFRRADFDRYCATAAIAEAKPGGLFMPCAFLRKLFDMSGGYPEGNIYEGGIGANTTKFLQSGDAYFFEKIRRSYGLKHVTMFNSLVYHIQEGEKDETAAASVSPGACERAL